MPAATASRPSTRDKVDLITARSLKQALESDFAVSVSPIEVLEAYGDRLPDNPFARSLRDTPLRQLGGVMATQDRTLCNMALQGKPIQSPIRVQSGDGPSPRMSVGYRLADDRNFALEVRLQHADPQSVLRAQTIVHDRVGKDIRVPIGIVSKVRAHPGGRGPCPGALDNDPLTIGSSVAHLTGEAGTLGVFVQKRGKTGFLSCSHVLSKCGSAVTGDAIHHPAPCDNQMSNLHIGALCDFDDLRLDQVFTADAAFAELAGGAAALGNMIPTGQGWPGEGLRLGSLVVGSIPEPNARVAKLGRTTGRTTGHVSLENVGPTDIYMALLGRNVTLEGLIEVRWDDVKSPFSDFGDSGSMVYLDSSRAPIGILIGGGLLDRDGVKVGVSYVCPLPPILQAWGLTLS